MAKNVLVLKHFESPKEAGVYYRLVCLTGANKGESYVLIGNRIILGRSEKADIRLNDSKTSREHAEITKVGDDWIVTDLGSQNGVMINDKKITQMQITESDKLIIGQTVFKFAKVEVSSKEQVIKEDTETQEKRKTLVPFLILILVLVAVFLLDENENSGQKKETNDSNSHQDVSSEYINQLKKRQANEDKQVKQKLEIIYQRGLREYREGNYFRAIEEFSLALIIAPGDSQAEHYLRKTKENLDGAIEALNVRAIRDIESLKYQSAIVSYCSIMRLLYSVPGDQRYKNAEEKIRELEIKQGYEPGETNCLKKQRTSQ